MEGDTDDPEVLALAFFPDDQECLCRTHVQPGGHPMFLSGDEFGDTRFGNNNPYCQDNPISWLDWNLLHKNEDLFKFFRYMIAFRKEHPAIRKDLEPSYIGFPSMSMHGQEPWNNERLENAYTACVLFAGYGRRRRPRRSHLRGSQWHTGIRANLTLPELPETILLEDCSQYRRSETADLHCRSNARGRKKHRPRANVL